jgi:hypothetical protein
MQPSWLVAWSTNFDNDPVRRGHWVRERLLGGNVPDLPIGVVAQVPDEPQEPFRHRLRVTRAGSCWKCHNKMDELGLPFEQFDHFGRFRTTETVLDPEATRKNVDKNGKPLGMVYREVALHRALEPLAAFKDHLTLLHGLSGRIALSDHSGNHGALGAYPANKGPMGQTIDLALSEALPGVVPHIGLGLAERPDMTNNYQISASARGKTVPIQCSPELAFKGLFGSVAKGSGREAFDRRTNLLDFMAEDVKRARGALAGEERAKLDQYLEAFEALLDRQGRIEAIRDKLVANVPDLSDKFKKPTETNRLQAQFALAAASLIAGLTNVVTLVSGGGGQHYISFPELGIPVGGHHMGTGAVSRARRLRTASSPCASTTRGSSPGWPRNCRR